jgi:Mg-chelatase subunit ChlD
MRISGSGLRPETVSLVPFYPGLDEFDLDATLEHTLDKAHFATYTDIVGIERKSRKKIGTIILDTSGSMTGPKLLTSALAAAVAAYHLRQDQYALIAFNTAAQTIKTMNQNATIDFIVDTILDTEPAGFTNIADGLETAYREYQSSRRRESWAVLITDGITNRGGSPYTHASRYHSLHVLQTPGIHPQGNETCQRIADLGGGHHIKVNDYTDVPHALMRLLRYTR